MNKWQEWYDGLPQHTQEYLDSRPLWHGSDLLKVGIMGMVIGIIIGIILRG